MTTPDLTAASPKPGIFRFDRGAINLLRDTDPARGKTVVVQTYADCFGDNFYLQFGKGEGVKPVQDGFKAALEESIKRKGPLAEAEARLIEFEGRKMIIANTFGGFEVQDGLKEFGNISKAVEKATANALIEAKAHNIASLTFPAMRGYGSQLGHFDAARATALAHHSTPVGVASEIIAYAKDGEEALIEIVQGIAEGKKVALALGIPVAAAAVRAAAPEAEAAASAASRAEVATAEAAAAEKGNALMVLETPNTKIAAEGAQVETGLFNMIRQNPGRAALAAAAAAVLSWAAYEMLRSKDQPSNGQNL